MFGNVATMHLQRADMPVLLTRHRHMRGPGRLPGSMLRSVADKAASGRRELDGASPVPLTVRAVEAAAATGFVHG
ncbi:MAG: hypothetical protein IT305_23820 [Chloroflexi bacterium]|nr:hypothetical protein [Chloroflexota bacterium]